MQLHASSALGKHLGFGTDVLYHVSVTMFPPGRQWKAPRFNSAQKEQESRTEAAWLAPP